LLDLQRDQSYAVGGRANLTEGHLSYGHGDSCESNDLCGASLFGNIA
jgi:hypothetical protein